MAVPNMIVTLLARTDGYAKGLRKAAGQTKVFGMSVTRIFQGVITLIGGMAYAFGRFAWETIQDASNLQQAIGGVESVFGKFADDMAEKSKAAAQNLGLSMEQYQRLGTMSATLLKNAGTPMRKLVGQTDTLLTLAADLAATFGGTVEEAATAMNAALRGEFEPIRRFGIALSIAQIQEKALLMTHKSSTDQLTKREKILATQTLLLEQGADASGQFARESDTLANKQQILNAKWENLSAVLGEKLLPFAEAVADALTNLVDSPGFKKALATMVDKFKEFGDWITSPDGQKAIKEFGDNLPTVVEGVADLVVNLKKLSDFIFGDGTSKEWRDFWKFMDNPLGNLTGWKPSTPSSPNKPGGNPSAPGGPPAGARSKASVVVNFNTPVDSVSAGREVARVLDSYSRANGRR